MKVQEDDSHFTRGPFKRFAIIVVAAISISLGGCVSEPYGNPPDSQDPWVLIRSARGWLQQGRPRAAMPSLEKALASVERLDRGSSQYLHAKAAIFNEFGRVHEMVNQLDLAETNFLKAAEIAAGVPQIRPLHFEIRYNLSTIYEEAGKHDASCRELQSAEALRKDLLARPAEPPEGYGVGGERFLRDIAEPRIRKRAQRLGCTLPE